MTVNHDLETTCMDCRKPCVVTEDIEYDVSEFWGHVSTSELHVEFSECCESGILRQIRGLHDD